jgi:hypothetical protein
MLAQAGKPNRDFENRPQYEWFLLTIFLPDSSYLDYDGFIAMAEKMPGTAIFIATHFRNSWFGSDLREKLHGKK